MDAIGIRGARMNISMSDLTGSWILESLNFEFEDNGEVVTPFGPDPIGALIVTVQGRMMAILTANHRPATVDDVSRVMLFDSMTAYSGKFKLSGNTFTTIVDASWATEWLGTEQVRYLQLDGRTLSIRSASHQHPRFPNRRGVSTLKWRRED